MKNTPQRLRWLIVFVLSLPLLGFIDEPLVPYESAVSQQTPLVVDFQWLGSVPPKAQQPIQAALEMNRASLPAIARWTVSVFRQMGDWAEVVIVPSAVVESSWEIELRADELLIVIAHSQDDGWVALLETGSAVSRFRARVPEQLRDYSEIADQRSHDLLFPWTSGNQWQKSGVAGGWHGGNSLDFRPGAPNDVAVLAAAAGTVNLTCGGPLATTNDPFQAQYTITHHDGTTTSYLHLDSNTIDPNIIGQNVPRGWYLGDIYQGNIGAGPCDVDSDGAVDDMCQFATPCGKGATSHLHFTVPNQNVIVDGNNINTVATSPFLTPFTSTNARIDPCFPRRAGDWNIRSSCIFSGNATAPGNVVVENGAVFTIFPGANLDIDFVNFHLRVGSGSRVQIIAGGRVH